MSVSITNHHKYAAVAKEIEDAFLGEKDPMEDPAFVEKLGDFMLSFPEANTALSLYSTAAKCNPMGFMKLHEKVGMHMVKVAQLKESDDLNYDCAYFKHFFPRLYALNPVDSCHATSTMESFQKEAEEWETWLKNNPPISHDLVLIKVENGGWSIFSFNGMMEKSRTFKVNGEVKTVTCKYPGFLNQAGKELLFKVAQFEDSRWIRTSESKLEETLDYVRKNLVRLVVEQSNR